MANNGKFGWWGRTLLTNPAEEMRGAGDIGLETHSGGKRLTCRECIERSLERFISMDNVGVGDLTSLVILGDQLLFVCIIYTS